MSATRLFNPFPGLRPFQTDEDYLFFGREQQTAELLRLLREHRFLAVVGTSGSGKSSLVRAGLLPELQGGTINVAGSSWDIAILPPGGDPIRNLAQALCDAALYDPDSIDIEPHLVATLRRSSLGLVEAVHQSDLETGANFLVVVDQFEEIFRFRQTSSANEDTATGFVNLLLEASQQRELPIYVVLTMRSDYIGDCAEFRGLAEAVNCGEYLIPRLRRDQLRAAIEGPARVGGGTIADRLVQELLNDVGNDQDQLPILQHALMRTWSHWEVDHRPEEPLDLRHYESAGGMRAALSRHADEIYDELADDRLQLVAERLFKALTEQGADNRGIRRPARMGRLCAIVDATEQEVATVIEAFRRQGRTFLMPMADVRLTPQTVIDISHESLMRAWRRLDLWVEEESQSARVYRRLADTAHLHGQGKAGVYHDPDLQIALSWRESAAPNAEWAQQYHDGFRESMAFLDASLQAQRADEQQREAARQRELTQAHRLAGEQRSRAEEQHQAASRLRWVVGGLCLIAIVAVVASGVAWRQWRIALQSADTARNLATVAKAQKQKADLLRTEADGRAEEVRRLMYAMQLSDAERLDSVEALERLDACEEELRGWEWHRLRFVQESSSDRIDGSGERPVFALLPQSKRLVIGDRNGNLQVRELTRENNWPLLSETRVEFVIHALACSHDEQFLVIAGRREGQRELEMELFEVSNLERIHAFRGVPDSWWISLATSPTAERFVAGFGGAGARVYELSNPVPLHTIETPCFSVDYHPSGDRFAASNLGASEFDALSNNQMPLNELHLGTWVSGIRYSPNGELLLLKESQSDEIVFWDPTRNTSQRIARSDAHTNNDQLDYLSNERDVVFNADSSISIVNVAKKRVVSTYEGERWVKTAAFSPDRKSVLFASTDGIRSWSWRKPLSLPMKLHDRPLREVTVHPNGFQFASCGLDGTVRIWDSRTAAPLKTLLAHTDFVPCAEYSPNGQLLASGGADNVIHLWDTTTWDRVRTLRGHRDLVYWLRFSPDGKYLASGAEDRRACLWDVDSGQLSAQTPEQPGPIEGLAFSRDGRYLVTGTARPRSDRLRSWDVENQLEPAFELRHRPTNIRGVAFSYDGLRLAAGAGEGVLVFDWREPSHPPLLLRTASKVRNVFFMPQPQPRLVTAAADGTIGVWNIEHRKDLITLSAGLQNTWDVAVAPETATMIVAEQSGRIVLVPSRNTPPELANETLYNLAALQAIQSAIKKVDRLSAASSEAVVDMLRKDTSLDEATRELAINYASSVVEAPVNDLLERVAQTAVGSQADARRYQDATIQVNQILQCAPGYPTALLWLAVLQYRLQDEAASLLAIEQASQAYEEWGLGETPVLLAARALALHLARREEEARIALALAQKAFDETTSVREFPLRQALLREAEMTLAPSPTISNQSE